MKEGRGDNRITAWNQPLAPPETRQTPALVPLRVRVALAVSAACGASAAVLTLFLLDRALVHLPLGAWVLVPTRLAGVVLAVLAAAAGNEFGYRAVTSWAEPGVPPGGKR